MYSNYCNVKVTIENSHSSFHLIGFVQPFVHNFLHSHGHFFSHLLTILYVCVCMYVCLYVSMYAWKFASMNLCMRKYWFATKDYALYVCVN